MAAITEELPADGGNPPSYELLKSIDEPAQLRALERKQARERLTRAIAALSPPLAQPLQEVVAGGHGHGALPRQVEASPRQVACRDAPRALPERDMNTSTGCAPPGHGVRARRLPALANPWSSRYS